MLVRLAVGNPSKPPMRWKVKSECCWLMHTSLAIQRVPSWSKASALIGASMIPGTRKKCQRSPLNLRHNFNSVPATRAPVDSCTPTAVTLSLTTVIWCIPDFRSHSNRPWTLPIQHRLASDVHTTSFTDPKTPSEFTTVHWVTCADVVKLHNCIPVGPHIAISMPSPGTPRVTAIRVSFVSQLGFDIWTCVKESSLIIIPLRPRSVNTVPEEPQC